MKELKPEITQEYLRECFDYCPETGALAWRERPREHFLFPWDQQAFNKRKAGTDATKSQGSRRVVRMLGKYCHYAQRVIWCWMTGEYPEKPVVFQNGNPHDLRWSNLRA